MDKKDAIKMISTKFSDFSTKVEQQDKTYYILTELSGSGGSSVKSEPVTIRTTIYLEGSHIETIKTITSKGDESKLIAIMENQHNRAIKKIKEGETVNKAKIAYFREIKRLVLKEDPSRALEVVRKALSEFPEDPFLNSYYGYLMATVEGKYQEGVKICQEALLRLRKYEHFGFEFLYPLFYLNLGRVYLSAGLKKNAVENFRRGLSFDPENQEILSELKGMGIRKGPAIAILQRNNPLNKYFGLLLTRLKSGTSNP